MGPRESQDLRSPSPIMAPDESESIGLNEAIITLLMSINEA